MIDSIEIDSFKSFRSESIPVKGLNILTGLNGSGKSTIIHSFRMVLESLMGHSPFIKGFGGFDELKCNSSSQNEIKISITEDKKCTGSVTLTKQGHRNSDVTEILNFDYIGADRLGPSSTLPFGTNDRVGVGDKGQFCVDFFWYFENVLVQDELLHPKTKSRKLSHQLDAWMGEISPGVSLNFFGEKKHDISHIEIDNHRATNTGFGISYALPIVLSVLVMSSRDSGAGIADSLAEAWFERNLSRPPLLLVENPEAHLHPMGQTAMGKLLALASGRDVQIVAETHSDHFLDGVRIQAKDGKVDPNNVAIYFFEKSADEETLRTSIKLDDRGKLNKWPKGFFDQSAANLRNLAL
jgi:predicted ATPase